MRKRLFDLFLHYFLPEQGQKLGQAASEAGDVALDGNFRPAEWGETVYQRSLRNRGHRPRRIQT